MKLSRISLFIFALGILVALASCNAASVTGTVTNKTTNRPSAGDSVALIDVQAGMQKLRVRPRIPSATTHSIRPEWVPISFASITREARTSLQPHRAGARET